LREGRFANHPYQLPQTAQPTYLHAIAPNQGSIIDDIIAHSQCS